MTPTTAPHPKALRILFFTEMWERFSYYGMRALLVLYLVNALDYTRADALQLYATYTGLVYLTPLLGGYLADRWLGQHRAIFIGGSLMALGHFAMAVPSLLHLALGLLVIGNGFFKPNISTLVGALYTEHDPRRDGGFTLFYMGINLGAFLAPLLCGTLGEKLGWHYGFAAAGVGMIFGLCVFAWGQKQWQTPPLTAQDGRLIGGLSLAVLLSLIACLWLWDFVGPAWRALPLPAKLGIPALMLLAIAALRQLWFSDSAPTQPQPQPLTKEEYQRISAILIVGVFIIFFWMGFEQAGGTMNLFAEQKTDRLLWGWEIPASYFQSINPLVILLLAPAFAVFWLRLDQSAFALSILAKQAIGMMILGLGFLVLAIADDRAQLQGQVSPLWLLSVYVLHTIGELCLSPIGLSMVSKLAPARLAAFMMGIWFGAMALANYLAGTLESLLQNTGIPLYWFLLGSAFGAGVLLLLLSPFIGKLMHGRA